MSIPGAHFEAFLRAFPKSSDVVVPNATRFRECISREFGIQVPRVLYQFWTEVGTGYFGHNRDLLFFGDDDGTPGKREGLVAWNSRPFFREIGPLPEAGGPLFFAETCFGVQIGMQRINGRMAAIFFDVDCYESFVLTSDIASLFKGPLADCAAITDPARLQRVMSHLGPLSLGQHYAPIVSPLVGGSDEVVNFSVQDPTVHFTTAVAIRKSVVAR